MSRAVITGWIISLAGMALWLYGYFSTGNPSLIDWHASTPWWIADFLPNVEFVNRNGARLRRHGPDLLAAPAAMIKLKLSRSE